jgi:Clp amino terminal domain, pathogenicity island component
LTALAHPDITLDDLIGLVERRSAEPKRRLETAVTLSAELESLGDRLVDHYVQAARHEGRSWLEIGRELGVTRQAAHQRFGASRIKAFAARRRAGPRCESVFEPSGEPFARFTSGGKNAMSSAQEEARALGHNYLGTEHVLLGLIAENRGVASKTLRALDVTADEVRRRIVENVGRGPESPSGVIAMTPRTKKVLELSDTEAKRLRQDFVDTEHLLLALEAEGEGMAAKILVDSGVPLPRVRQAVLGLISH